MRMLAAASTIPVTKAAKQKNSKSSLRIVVMYPCASAPIGWGRLGPRPGRVCLVLLTPVDEGRGGPDLAAMHEARRPQRRCKRSGFAPAARRCGSGSSQPLACLRRGAVVTRLRRTTIGPGDVAVSPDQPFDRSS